MTGHSCWPGRRWPQSKTRRTGRYIVVALRSLVAILLGLVAAALIIYEPWPSWWNQLLLRRSRGGWASAPSQVYANDSLPKPFFGLSLPTFAGFKAGFLESKAPEVPWGCLPYLRTYVYSIQSFFMAVFWGVH